MADVELLLREYGREVNDRCLPITVAEVARHLERTAVDGQGRDDLPVGDVGQPDEGAAPARRKGLLAAVAATILVVVGIVVVANRIDGDNATDVSTSPSPSREWSRVPHDEEVFGGSAMRDVTVGGPGLVAVGATAGTEDPLGVAATADTAAVVWTSTDGISWSRVPHDEAVFAGAVMHAVTAHGEGLVAIGFDSAANSGAVVWTSSDGISWSRVPHDETVFGGANMWDVTVAGSGLVAVGAGDSGPVVWTSADGTTWSRVPHNEAVFDATDTGMLRVTAGGPGLVAVGWDMSVDVDAAVWTSADGTTWSRVPHDEAVFGGEDHAAMSGVTAHGQGLVAVGEARSGGIRGAAVWTSADGITWDRLPHDETAFRDAFMVEVTAVGPLLVVVGESDSGMAAWTSLDATSWSRVVDHEVVFGRSALLGVTTTDAGLVAVGWDHSRGDSVAAVWRN